MKLPGGPHEYAGRKTVYAVQEMPETEAERKRREKAEKKAGKPKFKPVR